MIFQLVMLIHVFAAVFIIALVLVQQGKGATLGAAFGSGASQTVFGSRGSGSFLFRITLGLAAAFFMTSIGLNYIAARASRQEQVIHLPANPIPTAPASQTLPVTPDRLHATEPSSSKPVKKELEIPARK